jgi:tetratricopeptide (TPR) repeat protein
VWFVRLESTLGRWLVVGAVMAAAGTLAWSVIKPGLAEWIWRGAIEAADLERVAAWDPSNPAVQTRLGRMLKESADPEDLARARAHLEAALRQWPSHGFAWLHLADALYREGDRDRAQQALDRALRLDAHNVTLRWEAATLLLQRGDPKTAAEHLRYVVAIDPQQRRVAFQLLRRLAGPVAPMDELLPTDTDALTAIVRAAIREADPALARAAWERRARLSPALPLDVTKGYLKLLIDHGEGEPAARAWSLVAPDGKAGDAANGVWNGSFEGDPLIGWGLGWRLVKVWGAQVQVDRTTAAHGIQSLRLSFNSFPNLRFRGVFQTVPVRPGGRYRLEAQVRATDFTTRSGLKLQAVAPDNETVIAETGMVSGTTSGWVPISARVNVPADVSLVTIVICREPAAEPEGNLGGRVWVDNVVLVPVREAA